MVSIHEEGKQPQEISKMTEKPGSTDTLEESAAAASKLNLAFDFKQDTRPQVIYILGLNKRLKSIQLHG